MESLKKYAEDELVQAGLWVAGFIGVCVLVGLGKLKPETVEYMLFALIGRTAASNKKAGE